MLSDELLREMFPNAGDRLTPHLPYINPAMEWGEINTPLRIAAFLAQLAHESSEYRYMEEIADGSQYEGRLDLGNTHPGDGVKYKGHGPIQITGRDNHGRCGNALRLNLIDNPLLLTKPEYGTLSSAWFWGYKALNVLADVDDFREITRRINGGYTHYADRVEYWVRNRKILGLEPPRVMLGPIRRGDMSTRVIELQQKLGVTADGKFGPATEEALTAFQSAHGLTPDGVAGPQTLAELGMH